MQVLLIVLGAILGLIYGYKMDGFIFSSKICLFAGITLIMPTLFNVKLKDIRLIFQYKIVFVKSILVNYLVLPTVALIIGLLTNNFGIAAGMFLLSVLGGGGMVMHWIKQSEGDTSIGFILLFMNLLFVSLSLLMLHTFGLYTASYFEESYADEVNVSNFAQAVINYLIIVPFIVSRVVMFIKPLVAFIEKQRSYISNVSIFVIIFYLFGLQNSQMLFELYDFEPELIYIALIAVLAFYFAVFLISKLLYRLDSPQEKAAFWHSVTRYITLALVISTFTSNTFGISIILPLMIAYIVQIPFASYLDKKMNSV